MDITQITDDVFWKEATRRWSQKTLTPIDPNRAEVMGAMSGGQQPQQQQRATTGYQIVCASCGKNATVPFNPKPGYPVYCLDCYKARC